MTIDYRGLNAFLNIARLGSVGAAATALSLTQPAVSRTLRKLEQQLGVPLFLRRSTGMELTGFGQSLLTHATLLEAGAHRALEEIKVLRGASKGLARVGILPSLVPGILPMVLTSVRAKLPDIQIHLLEAPNHQLIRALLRREVDFIVGAVPPELDEQGIHVTPLMNDEICIVARATHPIAKIRSPQQKQLRECYWALQERGGLIWHRFTTLFTSAGLDPPPVVLTANSVQTLKAAIISNEFVTMLPRIAIRNEEVSGVLKPIRVRTVRWHRQLGILRWNGLTMLPAVEVVLTEIRKTLIETARQQTHPAHAKRSGKQINRR